MFLRYFKFYKILLILIFFQYRLNEVGQQAGQK